MKKFFLEIVVFSVGTLVMILELTASRILAPYVGTSIIAWTSLLGVILASLSLGYWLGGKLSDKNPDLKVLAKILLLAGIWFFLLTYIKTPLLSLLEERIFDLRILATTTSFLLFAFPNVLLGMVLPFAVKLKLKTLKKSGETAGSLYALSTVGSIIGTFLTGFFLLAFLGSTKILLVCSFFLVGLSILIGISRSSLFFLITIGLLAYKLPLPVTGYYQSDTAYSHFILTKGVDPKTQRPILSLVTGRSSQKNWRQSSMFLDSDDDLVITYTRFFRRISDFGKKPQKVLMIGGGGYSYPKDFLKNNPQGLIHVVEIDPAITSVAKRFFNLKEDPRLTIFHQDGRFFLNRNREMYDAVLLDAYISEGTMPFELTTLEAVERIFSSLNDEGVVMVNLISPSDPNQSRFIRLELETYRSVFGEVSLHPVRENPDRKRINVILVAKKTGEEISQPKTEAEILTDDFAPVEYLVAKEMLEN